MKKITAIIITLSFLLTLCIIPLAAKRKIIKTTNITNISGVLKPNHIIKMENVSIFSEITKGKFSAAGLMIRCCQKLIIEDGKLGYING